MLPNCNGSVPQTLNRRKNGCTHPKNIQPYTKKASERLEKAGFSTSVDTKGWFSFKKGNTEYTERVWDDLDESELEAIESGEDFPPNLKNTYKICVDIEPYKLPEFIEMLDSQFSGVPLYGRMVKESLLSRENSPNVILYLRGSHRNEVLDFTVNLAYATRLQMGEAHSHLDKALETLPGSGVYITQGTYNVKLKAESLGEANRYSLDGSVFASEYDKITKYLERRKNQFLIEENMHLFNGLNISEKLTDLQLAAFDGIDPGIDLGIRQKNVSVGEYMAPKYEVVPQLLENLDTRYRELVERLGENPTYEQATRLAAFAYTAGILVHPLENGNGQSNSNVVTSCLYDRGFRRIFINPFMDGRLMRSRAFGFIGTQEAPTSTDDSTVPSDPDGKQEFFVRLRRENSYQLLKAVFKSSAWESVSDYVLNGDYTSTKYKIKHLEAPYKDYGESFLSRMAQIGEFLQDNLSETPFGSKKLSIQELEQAQEETVISII